MTTQTQQDYEIAHDKVRIKAGDPRQWLVWVGNILRAECTTEQAAKDFVAIAKGKAD